MNLYNKDGDPIEAFDIDGNLLDETLTQGELEEKLSEAKEAYQIDVEEVKNQLSDKEESLKLMEEELGKEKEKDKNFSNLRKSREEKETEANNLKDEIKGVKEEINSLKKGTENDNINNVINELTGEDGELKKKVKHYYDNFITPEDDNLEKRKERVMNAYTLASGSRPANPLSGGAISSSGGTFPDEVIGGGEKLSGSARSVATKLGISDNDLKRHKLI